VARPTLFTHRKFARLADDLGSEALALGHLEFIWSAASQSGNDLLGDARDVELAARWRGEPGTLCHALLTAGGAAGSGFIDERGGLYYVHDLFDHAPDYVRRRAEREAVRVASGRSLSEIRSEAGKKGGRPPAAKQAEASGKQTNSTCLPAESKTKANVATPSPTPTLTPTLGTTTSKGVSGSISSELRSVVSTAPAPPGGPEPGASPGGTRSKKAQGLPPIPDELDTPEFRAAWAGRRQEREQRGRDGAETPAQVAAQLSSLVDVAKDHGIASAVDCVRRATAGAWKSVVYPDRLPSGGSGSKNGAYHPAGRPQTVAGIDRSLLGAPADLDEHERQLQEWDARIKADGPVSSGAFARIGS